MKTKTARKTEQRILFSNKIDVVSIRFYVSSVDLEILKKMANQEEKVLEKGHRDADADGDGDVVML